MPVQNDMQQRRNTRGNVPVTENKMPVQNDMQQRRNTRGNVPVTENTRSPPRHQGAKPFTVNNNTGQRTSTASTLNPQRITSPPECITPISSSSSQQQGVMMFQRRLEDINRQLHERLRATEDRFQQLERSVQNRSNRNQRDSDSDESSSSRRRRRRPARRNNPNIINKPPVFDGHSLSWESFKSMFEMRAEALSWNEQERFLNMRMCLAGKAVEYFIKLEDQGKCDTYHDFIRRMELRFSHKDDPATVRMQFSNLRQMLDESLEDWGERVMTLAYQAFSGLDAAFVEHEMVNRFCAGLYDKDAAQFVMNSTPTSMEDALRRVRRYQENAISIYGNARKVRTVSREQSQSHSEQRTRSPNPATPSKAMQPHPKMESDTNHTSKENTMTEMMRRLIQQQQEIMNHIQPSPPMQNPSASPKRKSACFNCNSPDHFANDCPKRGTCFICSSRDHFAANCPHREIGACYFCGKTDHKMPTCPKMFADMPNPRPE